VVWQPYYIGDEMSQFDHQRLKTQYKKLYDEISQILFHNDPIGINFEDNTDEYEPEVGTILPRLKEATSEADVLDIVHEEFIKWFGGEDVVGPRSRYKRIAQDIWHAWTRFQNTEAV